MQAGQAMQIIAFKPRLAGLGLGGILYIFLCSAYFIFGQSSLLRSLEALPIDPTLTSILCNLILSLIGTTIIVFTSRVFAGRAIKIALTGLTSPAAIQKIIPPTGWTLWAGFGLAIIITFLLFIAFS